MDLEKKLVCPGERVGHVDDNDPGEGTYLRGPYIHSSIVGIKDATTENGRTIISVKRDEQPNSILVPELHAIVTARVTKVNSRFASVVILCVGSKPLKEPFLGIIRSQDIRATEQDKVEVYKCFRPGDIVLAEVISLGDSRSYFLGTAKNELGVVFAKSVTGTTMIPISWQEMVCPKTLQREFRKVAKITNS